MYEIPSAAGGDEGVEGFSIVVAGERVGRAAALNDTPQGLVLGVDTGDAYRAVPAGLLAQIDIAGNRIRLTPEGEAAFAAAPEVQPRVLRGDGPRLVRHLPRELDRLLVAGRPERTRRSRLWYVGALLVAMGAVGAMAGPVAAVEGVGGTLRWLWVAIPVAVLVLGAAALWTALGRDSPRRLSAREKASDALTAALGISPRTRRRG